MLEYAQEHFDETDLESQEAFLKDLENIVDETLQNHENQASRDLSSDPSSADSDESQHFSKSSASNVEELLESRLSALSASRQLGGSPTKKQASVLNEEQ